MFRAMHRENWEQYIECAAHTLTEDINLHKTEKSHLLHWYNNAFSILMSNNNLELKKHGIHEDKIISDCLGDNPEPEIREKVIKAKFQRTVYAELIELKCKGIPERIR